mmetsp:Transcript_35348/g.57772  ORF Transcript_35348/g.57772 Transcript_35348/m.57772 type:complete len:244 (+) Transcript_35348:1496-2227(+)
MVSRGNRSRIRRMRPPTPSTADPSSSCFFGGAASSVPGALSDGRFLSPFIGVFPESLGSFPALSAPLPFLPPPLAPRVVGSSSSTFSTGSSSTGGGAATRGGQSMYSRLAKGMLAFNRTFTPSPSSMMGISTSSTRLRPPSAMASSTMIRWTPSRTSNPLTVSLMVHLMLPRTGCFRACHMAALVACRSRFNSSSGFSDTLRDSVGSSSVIGLLGFLEAGMRLSVGAGDFGFPLPPFDLSSSS